MCCEMAAEVREYWSQKGRWLLGNVLTKLFFLGNGLQKTFECRNV